MDQDELACSCIDLTSYKGGTVSNVDTIPSKLFKKLQPAHSGSVSFMRGPLKYNRKDLYAKLYLLDEININGRLRSSWLGLLLNATLSLYTRCPVGSSLDQCLLERGIAPPLLLCMCTYKLRQAFLAALPLLKGETLLFRLSEAIRTNKGWISRGEAVRYFCRLLKAVYYLASSKVVHGDLNPSNIMLSKKYLVSVIDTDGMISMDTAERYGPLFAPLNMEFDYLNIIYDEFQDHGELGLLWRNIDYFMFILNTMIIAALSLGDPHTAESDILDTCCWEEFVKTRTASLVRDMLDSVLIDKYLKDIIKNPVKHVKSKNRIKEIYNFFYNKKGICSG